MISQRCQVFRRGRQIPEFSGIGGPKTLQTYLWLVVRGRTIAHLHKRINPDGWTKCGTLIPMGPREALPDRREEWNGVVPCKRCLYAMRREADS